MIKKEISIGDKKIILIGTAHVLKSSVELVEETIKKEKPEFIIHNAAQINVRNSLIASSELSLI